MDKSELSHFTDAEFQQRFNYTKDRLSKNKTRQENPVAFLLGGQPGAGKSTLHALAKDKLNKDVITIDNDTFKIQHPKFAALVKEYGKNYVEHVTPFSNRMTEALIDYFSKEGFNLTIEGTLRTAETPMKTASALKEKGYEVNLYVMAVSKDLSYLGTLERYESMYATKPQTARSTDKAIHDTVVSNLPNNLDILFKGNHFADISLFTREGTKVYSSVEIPSISPKEVISNVLNEKSPRDVLLNKIECIINQAKQNNHQLPELSNWQKELKQQGKQGIFSLKGVKEIDTNIKGQQQDQAKDKKRDQSL